MDITLRGKLSLVESQDIDKNISTGGHFPKAWQSAEHGFVLLKGGTF